MIKSQKKATDTLIEMGYQPDMISLAMEESINKSLEEVLDLLLFRDKHYRKLLKKKVEQGINPKLGKRYSLLEPEKSVNKNHQIKSKSEVKVNSEEDWTDEDIEEDWEDEKQEIILDVPVEVMRVNFGQNPTNVKLGKDKNSKKKKNGDQKNIKEQEKEENKEEKIEIQKSNEKPILSQENLPKVLDTEIEHYLNKILVVLCSINSDDPNAYIMKLEKYLEKFEKDATPENITLQRYLCSELKVSKILELKNQIFAMLNKLLTMKIKKKFTLNVKKLEAIILRIFEMRLLSAKQMDFVIICYKGFCDRVLYPGDEIYTDKLRKCYFDTVNADPVSAFSGVKKEDVINILEDKSLINNPNLISVIVQNKENEESKLPDMKEENGEQDEIENALAAAFLTHDKSEECIVCMERTREIVFMPCCHFLTCPLCSPRIGKCPMCNKRIDKHLKIFWG